MSFQTMLDILVFCFIKLENSFIRAIKKIDRATAILAKLCSYVHKKPYFYFFQHISTLSQLFSLIGI